MRHFVEILKTFTQNQRLLVLVILLTFTTGGFLASQYMRSDDCTSLIKENLQMQEDFVKISSMLRKVHMNSNDEFVSEPALDSAKPVRITDRDEDGVIDTTAPAKAQSGGNRRPASEEIVYINKDDEKSAAIDSVLSITSSWIK